MSGTSCDLGGFWREPAWRIRVKPAAKRWCIFKFELFEIVHAVQKVTGNRYMIKNYKANNCFDEMLDGEGKLRAHYAKFQKLFQGLTPAEFEAKRQAVDMAFLRQGVTFNVYGDAQGAERIFPFDLVPRIIPAKEWEHIERGLVQRITALNLFLHDIYHEQKILKDGVIPRITFCPANISGASS